MLLWDIETYRILKTWFLDFLYAGHFVPSEVMVAYNKYFLWEINSEEYQQRYDDLFLTYIKEQMDGIIVPGYEYLMQKSGGDIEAYIRYRERGFAQYLIGDWDNANQNLSKAMEIIPGEPYLLCVFGALNVAMNEGDGKKYIKSGAEASADPGKMFLFSGLLLYRAGKDKKALRYYRKIPKTSCYYITAQLGISNWLYKRKRYHICGLLLRSRLKKDRNNTQLKMALSQYYNTILDLKKKFPNRLVFWYEARKIFPYVRNRGERNPHKYTLNYILPSLKLAGLTILGLLLLMGLIESRGRGIMPIIIVYGAVRRHKANKELS